MQITEIAVTVHEKRDNPHAYGHYDAEVHYTAEIQPGDQVDIETFALLRQAAGHVKAECNRFIERVEQEYNIVLAAKAELLAATSTADGDLPF